MLAAFELGDNPSLSSSSDVRLEINSRPKRLEPDVAIHGGLQLRLTTQDGRDVFVSPSLQSMLSESGGLTVRLIVTGNVHQVKTLPGSLTHVYASGVNGVFADHHSNLHVGVLVQASDGIRRAAPFPNECPTTNPLASSFLTQGVQLGANCSANINGPVGSVHALNSTIALHESARVGTIDTAGGKVVVPEQSRLRGVVFNGRNTHVEVATSTPSIQLVDESTNEAIQPMESPRTHVPSSGAKGSSWVPLASSSVASAMQSPRTTTPSAVKQGPRPSAFSHPPTKGAYSPYSSSKKPVAFPKPANPWDTMASAPRPKKPRVVTTTPPIAMASP
jgi:hypothetical protein